MVDFNDKITYCRDKLLNFIQDWESTKGLDIIIDIYDEIRYSGMKKGNIRQKYLKILYNIKRSKNWHTILEKEDWTKLELFLNEFLEIQYDGKNYYIGKNCFSNLSLDELYQILLEAKYIKEKEINSIDNMEVL